MTSASGKSTLARTLVGAWPAAAGAVRLDGVSVHAWHKSELGRYIGYLPQDIELFEGTLAENIARFDDVDTAALNAAIDAVGLRSVVDALPLELDLASGDSRPKRLRFEPVLPEGDLLLLDGVEIGREALQPEEPR
jgi:ATP-binding cassette subfamily C exporter for protease/lipase